MKQNKPLTREQVERIMFKEPTPTWVVFPVLAFYAIFALGPVVLFLIKH